ncbi:toprim domain-containing protein [uncultured Methylobacterium sp.]|uniref:DUF7146 domain-containing protein n=1 Tax=uncultured Methylobacterium sp. TaxID=157278 RepID=UPI0035C9BDD4
MPDTASELARRLAANAEAVCRHYLSNGRREGRWWTVGDIHNSPGRSMMVRLKSTDRGPAGKWTDAATGEHGDLLDLIAQAQGCATLADTLDEARRFLSLPRPEGHEPVMPAPQGSPEAARRLFAMSKPIRGTAAETYLRTRGITDLRDCTSLRFHPRCYYRGDEADPADSARNAWPALIAAATDPAGAITGVHRTWLAPSGQTKAPVSTPRRSMGLINGQGVRIGAAHGIVAVGEGLETMLSLRVALPDLPVIAAGSANHLDALLLSDGLRRLYVAEDDDPAGRRATASVMTRAEAAGIEAIRLAPARGDFNDDLRQLGREALHAALRVQLAPEDVERFWTPGRESARAA